MPRHYIRGTGPKCYADEMKPALLCGQPPLAVRRSEAPRLLRCSLLFLALLGLLALPSSAATWSVRAEPTTLLNGAPVLFRVQAPAKLETLRGSWVGHELTFSYQPSTKTWFALAGVSFDTTPGKYTLELSGENTAKSAVSFQAQLHGRTRPIPENQGPTLSREEVHRARSRTGEADCGLQ